MKNKREVDILVISDVHLGTYGCHAKELLQYLKSIRPKLVILNGDIIDVWQFSKNYWPKSHMKVIKQLLGWIGKGVKTYYITGNHDEMLRRYVGLKVGSFQLVNKVVIDLPSNKKAWFFHGDVFDITMQHSKWLAKLGAVGYDALILINSFVNFVSEKVFKKGKISFSKKIKESVKSAVKFVNEFEQITADIAISNKYDYVCCGHIHQPEITVKSNNRGSVVYLNSGDWIENLTSLEYCNGEWKLFRYNEFDFQHNLIEEEDNPNDLTNNQIFDSLLQEFNLMKQ